MKIKSIGVIGVGGVGGYFGGKLCRLLERGEDLKVCFIARGDHLRAIQESGLQLSTESDGELECRPTLATDDFRRLPPLDLCLVCVKEFDLPGALAGLAPIVGDETIVLPLLNGVDVYSRVRNVINRGVVLPACVYVGTHLDRPGRVCQKGGACQILFGPDPRRTHAVPQDVIDVFDQACIKSEWTIEIESEIWQKFIFIGPFGLATAAYGKTAGEVLEDVWLRGQAKAIMTEAASLAKRLGVALPEDVVEASLVKARGFPYEAKTSFQRDFERPDKLDERDLFAGAMLRLADELGVDAPATRAIALLLESKKPARSNPVA
jgi:2-dehydropantoate 2-reductase